MTIEQLDQEWLQWVKTNLERQCAPRDLYKIMREHGFSVMIIKKMLGDAYPEGIEQTETNQKASSIDYLALANPPLAANMPELIVQPFENDLVQLYTIENFLSIEQCETLIAISEQHLKPSQVTHSNGDPLFRTSETCDFMQGFNPFVKSIDERIAKAMGIRLPYSESIQVQRYSVGQEFKAHHDYFAPNTGIYDQFASDMGQRTWTFMVYLNSTPQGGGTRFVDLGHTFYPKQGMAVVWNNLHSDGTPNRHTLHHGMPVEQGKKVIITKWFREKGYGEMFYPRQAAASDSIQNNTQNEQSVTSLTANNYKQAPSIATLKTHRHNLSRQAKRAKSKRR